MQDIVPPPTIASEPVPGLPTKQSEQELSELFKADLHRDESLKQTLHTVIIWGLKFAAICLIACFIVRVFHLAAPESFLWLSEARLQKLDSILFSGALGAFISRYIGQATSKKQ